MRADVYRKINSSFWTDPKVRSLGRDAAWLFFYLMTNPHSHFCGIYYLPEAVIRAEAKIGAGGVRRAFNELSRNRMAEYDDANQVVFVRKMLVYQGAAGEKIKAGIVKHLRSLHETPLIPRFLNEYDGWGIPYRYSLDTVSVSGTGTGTGTGTGDGADAPPHQASSKKDEDRTEFERLWSLYPERAGGNPERAAFEAWKSRRREGVPAEQLEAAVVRYAAYCKATGKIGTEYVQQGATFFGPRKRGFEQDWKPPAVNGGNGPVPKAGINPNVLSRQSCGCEVVRDPGARDGRKTIPCRRHTDRATEVRA